jgi:hypothetical protein
MKPVYAFFSFARIVALYAMLVLSGQAFAEAGQQAPRAADSGFSFAVYGDSRTMMYLPPKADQKEETTKLLVDMFNLVLPEKIAEEVVRRMSSSPTTRPPASWCRSSCRS